MKSLNALPEGFNQIYEIDLQKNKKMSFLVNGIAIVIAAVMMVLMSCFVPISSLLNSDETITQLNIRMLVFFVSVIVYMVLHELVHGITMKMCGTKKVKYGFTGLYAFAGSDDYYDKKSYITIALAPVIVWGVVIAVINCFVPEHWFWIVYFIQIINVSGAAGDIFVTCKFSKFPNDILVRDHGVGMKVYSKNG